MASAGATQAGRYIHELLLRPPYRGRWEQFAERTRPDKINQLAVAEVLAGRLWDFPRKESDKTITARQLRDTVARALNGQMLSKSTLTVFLEAFDFTEPDRRRIWAVWEGSEKVRVLIGPRALPPKTAAAIAPLRHKTLSLHEHHQVGADGLPVSHRTQQVVEAIVDGFDRYPYRFDTNALTVEVGHGCRGIVGPLYEVVPGLYAVDIALSNPLALGETATLEYWAHFHYMETPPPEFRRAAQRRIESVDIRVQFHPDKLPAKIWWSVWDGLEGGIQDEEQVGLDRGFAVHRFLETVENTVVGFHWEW